MLTFSIFSVQCDYTLVQSSFTQLEAMCKASWEQLKVLERCEEKRKGGKGEKTKGKYNNGSFSPEGSLRHRLPKVLKECEERLKVLKAVHRRVINRCSALITHLQQNTTAATPFCFSCHLCSQDSTRSSYSWVTPEPW